MFEGFEVHDVDTGEVSIRLRKGGSGPPLLMLHGSPQTHLMWHRCAPRLAEHFTVVAPDLRGCGHSSKPPSTADHEPYSKRAMARDQVAVMQHFGFGSFRVAGHDRGARCGYRLALDHPARVEQLAVLDILPTLEHYRRAEQVMAFAYWHWFFLSQPYPVPETMIGHDPDFFFKRDWPDHDVPPAFYLEEALEQYLAANRDPETIHAMCEDYRAGAGFDSAADAQDLGVRKIGCPVLALWATKGLLPKIYDPVAVWRDWADDVRGWGIDSGHFLAEENAESTVQALEDFFLDRPVTP